VTDWNAALFTKLYSKMALALGVTPDEQGDAELAAELGEPLPPRYSPTAARQDPQFLLAILNPGQYVPADLNPAHDLDDWYALSVLLSRVPQFSWVYKPAASSVDNNYRSVLEYKEAPEVHLTPEQLKQLDAATKTAEKYEDVYEKYRDAYELAITAYDSAYADYKDGGPPVPPSLKRKVTAALQDWQRLGHRSAVDSATAIIARYEALEPETFWYKLTERFETGAQDAGLGSPFQPVGVSPPYKSWFGEHGWTSFSFDQKDMDNQQESQAIGVSGSLDGTFGIFKVSGDGDYSKDSSYTKMTQTELAFSCKLLRVSLDRPWMNPLVLSSRAWRWAPGTPTYGSQFSTGADIASDVAPTGTMTVIPTAAILSKDLLVKGNFTDTIVKQMNTAIKAKASVGIGPFSISGRFNMADHSGSQTGVIANNQISAPDVQIVAFVCEVLPKSPDPDPTLKWPNP
jgi:hypothetical protein